MAENDDSGSDSGRTTISVSSELADDLYDLKKRGDSYEDVIRRLIEQSEEDDS